MLEGERGGGGVYGGCSRDDKKLIKLNSSEHTDACAYLQERLAYMSVVYA